MKKRLTDCGPNPIAAVGAFAAAILTAAVAHSAELPAPPAPAGAGCVEVIPAQPGAAPAILFDRCSGETWQLVRSYAGRHGARYAWLPLVRQGAASAAPSKASAVAVPSRPKAPAASNSKCFSFNGRTFCE